ncbi:hypothetical protein Ciccas_012348 [Cichlidogyrus casuarinus]|uniref:Uncharacterized protein n=1 Tax=Cichlidogyrus casuarinus TaxID=1844966 RepID=A0ABD2PNR7_9PLAT
MDDYLEDMQAKVSYSLYDSPVLPSASDGKSEPEPPEKQVIEKPEPKAPESEPEKPEPAKEPLPKPVPKPIPEPVSNPIPTPITKPEKKKKEVKKSKQETDAGTHSGSQPYSKKKKKLELTKNEFVIIQYGIPYKVLKPPEFVYYSLDSELKQTLPTRLEIMARKYRRLAVGRLAKRNKSRFFSSHHPYLG